MPWGACLLGSQHCARAGKASRAPYAPLKGPGHPGYCHLDRGAGTSFLLCAPGPFMHTSYQAEGSRRLREPGEAALQYQTRVLSHSHGLARMVPLPSPPAHAGGGVHPEPGAQHPGVEPHRPRPPEHPALPPSILLGGRAGTMRYGNFCSITSWKTTKSLYRLYTEDLKRCRKERGAQTGHQRPARATVPSPALFTQTEPMEDVTRS